MYVKYTQKWPFFAMAEDELAKLMVAWRKFFMPIFHTIMTVQIYILSKVSLHFTQNTMPTTFHDFPLYFKVQLSCFCNFFFKITFYHGVSILGNEGTNSCNKSSAKMEKNYNVQKDQQWLLCISIYHLPLMVVAISKTCLGWIFRHES